MQDTGEVTGKRTRVYLFNGTNQEVILIRSQCEECAGEGGFHPKTLQETIKITALPG